MPMRPKQTLRANTYALPGGGILHVDKILVPILTEDQCPNCGKVMHQDSDHDDDGNETQRWLECANCENRIRLSAKPANSEVSGAGATASNDEPKSRTRQRSLD